MTARNDLPRPTPAAWLLILPIRFYQRFITPYTPATCRYYPTCSRYAVESLRTHGAAKGLLLTVWRLLRCNPWSSGGVDRTPERGHWRAPVGAAAGDDARPEGDVTHLTPHRHTCDTATSGIDDFARPSGGAPNAGRAAA